MLETDGLAGGAWEPNGGYIDVTRMVLSWLGAGQSRGLEVLSGVRVNAIAPGLIKTDFAKTLWTNPDRLARVENLLPLRRIGDPDEIAGTAVFLASDAANFLTGQVLNVDGGNAIV